MSKKAIMKVKVRIPGREGKIEVNPEGFIVLTGYEITVTFSGDNPPQKITITDVKNGKTLKTLEIGPSGSVTFKWDLGSWKISISV